MRRARTVGFSVMGAALILTGGAAGCSGEGDEGATSSSSSSGGEGGAGGGGGGGGSGGGGGGSGGAGGGSSAGCLDPSVHEAFFTIGPPDLCAVAIYDAAVDLAGIQVPTWGRHGGPITVSLGAAGALDVARWELPAGSATTGSLTKKTTSIPAGVPQGAYPGAQAVDLPFFDWTAVSWAGAFPSIEGEVILAKDAAIEQRYDVQSLFAAVGITSGAGQGRLLYTGQSPLDAPMIAKGALYAADSCGAAGNQPRLLPDGDPTCGPPIEVAAWGEFSGPVAADRFGNVFALMSSFSTNDQEARAFAASTIARGAPATPGDFFFKMPGYGMSLAVLSPKDAGGVGLLAFQPSDGMAGPLNVIEQRYRVDGAAVMLEGGLGALLYSAKPATSLALLADDQDRLWVGVPVNGATTFVVLARTKP